MMAFLQFDRDCDVWFLTIREKHRGYPVVSAGSFQSAFLAAMFFVRAGARLRVEEIQQTWDSEAAR